MREVVSAPFDGARVERLVADLRAQGQPVYLSPMVGFQAPYMTDGAFHKGRCRRFSIAVQEVLFQ